MLSSLIGATIFLSGFTLALPRPDSAIGAEVAVSVVDGVTLSDTAELAKQTASEAMATWSGMAAASTMASDSSSYGSSGSSYGSSGSSYGSSDSSYGSSGSSYGSSDSSYGSSDSSYGSDSSSGSDSSCGSGSSCDSSSGDMSAADSMSSSTAAWESTSTAAAWTSSAEASMSTSSISYGSGSSSWSGSSGYDDCVQQCVASFGGLSSQTYAPTATSGGYEGSSGTGATHTVIVAPSQGVLRYVPFALNASVGDTVMFMWGANNHTVTKSSQLELCNKTSDAPFVSGTHDKGFAFTQVINDTNPTFYYCGTPGHCQKGMFGIINPPNTMQGATSVGSMMQSVSANNSDVQAYAAYTTTNTAGSAAASWGTNLDMGSMPEWSYGDMMENVLFTRNFLAANPDVMTDDGSIDLSNMASTPLMMPMDVSAALNAASSDSTPATSSAAATTDVASSAAASSTAAPVGAASTGNGAGSLTSSKTMVGVVALLATVFLL